MLNEAIKKVIAGKNLTEAEAFESMNDIMSGSFGQAEIAGFLVALRMKGETIDEITGCAKAMKYNALPFKHDEEEYSIDTCGTGGDGGKTFNVSTAVAIICAAADLKVAKHGNRAISSQSGSADVLTELGIKIDMDIVKSEASLKQTGMAFLFAQLFHVAMKHAGPVRRALGVRTIFNILGPLTNPANIKGQVLGVFDGKLTHDIAEVLVKLGRERAFVVHGNDGLDEITTTTTTKVSEVRDGEVYDYEINPEDYGITIAEAKDISGGDAKENAKIITEIFNGKRGPKRDIVVLNSAAALYVGNVAADIKSGVVMAEEVIDSGKALEKLKEIVQYSQRS